MNILDLQNLNPTRIFVIGSLCGNYEKLIDVLYEQEFNHTDMLVLTGNFINKESNQLLDILHFLKNNDNCYSVLGKNEADFLLEWYNKDLPDMFYEMIDNLLIDYIRNLPLMIQLDYNYFVVNAGLQPFKPFKEQDDKVFYSIEEFDKESRYYQFFNPEEESWYAFEFEEGKIIFSNKELEETVVPAGYNLSCANKDLKTLIITEDIDPIIISLGEDYV